MLLGRPLLLGKPYTNTVIIFVPHNLGSLIHTNNNFYSAVTHDMIRNATIVNIVLKCRVKFLPYSMPCNNFRPHLLQTIILRSTSYFNIKPVSFNLGLRNCRESLPKLNGYKHVMCLFSTQNCIFLYIFTCEKSTWFLSTWFLRILMASSNCWAWAGLG